MHCQGIAVFGSTGSIGVNTLAVVAQHPERFRVVALSAHRQVDRIVEQALRHRPRWVIITDPDAVGFVRDRLQAEGSAAMVLSGADALCQVASDPSVDVVMAAIVGAAGLPSSAAAARAGKRLLLANKESLVVGGGAFMREVAQGHATLLPIDSEHSAIFQCLPADRSQWSSTVDHIVLTASGGPFRQRDPATLDAVTPAQACAHPTWSMGRKISVDSATMMNKALEVIEARWLFGLEPRQIRVVIHPQSIVHSMVVCRDQSVLAQLGTPDMRVPIAAGLAWPGRIASGTEPMDWMRLSPLTFEAPDPLRFPGLQLAWQALEGPVGTTAVLNAANEVAVDAFLNGRIRFSEIAQMNRRAIDAIQPLVDADCGWEDLLDVDTRTRSCVAEWVNT